MHTINTFLLEREHLDSDTYEKLYDLLHGVEARWAGECPVCRKVYVAKRRDKGYCSAACYLRSWRGFNTEVITCPVCGDKFIARHKGRVYCSNACKMVAYRRRGNAMQSGNAMQGR